MILVVGATGLLGGVIAQRLLAGGEAVRVLVRPGSGHAALERAGASPVLGDLKDPGSLARACAGADVVVTTATASARGGDDTVESVDLDGNGHLVEAAVAAGVRRLVFVSAAGADAAAPAPLFRAKGVTEDRLRASGLGWTVIAPEPFMDIWFPAVVGLAAVAGGPVTLVGDGRARHSFVAVRDVASCAVAALTHPWAADRKITVGGPEPVSWSDVVAEFERVLGRSIDVRSVAPGEPVPSLPPLMGQLMAFLESYESEVDMAETAAALGVHPTGLAEFVRGYVRSPS